MAPYFPFDDLGLSGNPFQSLLAEEWAQVAVLPEEVQAAWSQGGDLMVIGEKGRGKTTTLLGLARRAGEAGKRRAYERLPQGRGQFLTSATNLSVFFLDEAQRLNWRGKRQLTAIPSQVQLVIGSHTDLSPVLSRAGRRATTVLLDVLDHGQLAAILRRRLAYFSTEQPSRFQFADSAVTLLLESFGSDQRAMNGFLYEYFQRLPAPGVIEATDLRPLASQLTQFGP